MKTKRMPDGTIRYYINGIRVTKSGVRVHGAACKGRPGHIKPPELICDPAIAPGMCGEARTAAQLAIAAALTGLAVGAVADAPAAAPEGDQRADPSAATALGSLLTVAEAALRLKVSKGWLYRNAGALPFTVRLGEGQLRFSEAGIQAHIRAKSAA